MNWRHIPLIAIALTIATPATAQDAPAVPPAVPPIAAPGVAAPARTILFVGNSFTQGAHSAVRNWHAASVTDLNGDGYGGVPALFKTFTEEAGLDYAVSLETQGGKTLGFHYDERRQRLDRAWDVVVLQELSTLNRKKPGDDTDYIADVGRLARLFTARNPAVRIELMATWTRADETYRPTGHWYRQPVSVMATDLRAAADRARAATPAVAGVLPVGQAWNRAFATGVADPDPYDGISYGQVDLWTYDQYHASIHGYYLEALVVFGRITGRDPMSLGAAERAADELGISPRDAVALQRVAHDELSATP
ncbi:PEP-CTERM sorting domain-containing protein [Sphingomonas sp. EC-HK361]|uniref:DUF4886 domain-containing protein n=1 Tax=Sphingomonas sp. EC-HK361 TaxID=2038397 RepID=UPI001255C0F9|nr:DUF4886 domain-containing protein [Sphingomonas sp. EC-HK361]VVS98053.1 PEP-CTERM sorting domain-containing protein [Sphingomonas sp. EC-HK361]